MLTISSFCLNHECQMPIYFHQDNLLRYVIQQKCDNLAKFYSVFLLLQALVHVHVHDGRVHDGRVHHVHVHHESDHLHDILQQHLKGIHNFQVNRNLEDTKRKHTQNVCQIKLSNA
jgi:hypothetical protein